MLSDKSIYIIERGTRETFFKVTYRFYLGSSRPSGTSALIFTEEEETVATTFPACKQQ